MGRGFEPHTSPQQYQGLSVSDPLGPFSFMISFRVVCSTGSNHDEAKFDEAGRKPGSIVKPG